MSDILTDVFRSFTQPSLFGCASARFQAVATPISFLQPSVFRAAALQFRI
jgi:hypothetical protein